MSVYSIAVQPIVDNIVDAIEDVVARVPPSREGTSDSPAAAAKVIARKAGDARARLAAGRVRIDDRAARSHRDLAHSVADGGRRGGALRQANAVDPLAHA